MCYDCYGKYDGDICLICNENVNFEEANEN